MGKIVDKLIDWAIMFGLIGYMLVGTPAAPALQSAVASNVLSAPWGGPGNERVDKPTDCYGPSIPARPDLAPNPPYKQASVVQYIHGCEYSHAAVDYIAVGDDTVLSPINGCVVANTYDGVGNPVLKIENEQYLVTMLHGNYLVVPPECVRRGQPVGRDDKVGQYKGAYPINHTHLSIYDKVTGMNAHPLALIK